MALNTRGTQVDGRRLQKMEEGLRSERGTRIAAIITVSFSIGFVIYMFIKM